MRAWRGSWALTAAMLLLVPACGPSSVIPLSLDAGLDLPEHQRGVIQAARQGVVSIVYDYGAGGEVGRRTGSGFVVGPRLVVTDYHVVWGRPRFLTIYGPDGNLGPRGRLDMISESYDLALIVLEDIWLRGHQLPLATHVVPGSTGFALAGRRVPTACSRHTALVEVRGITVSQLSRGDPSRGPSGGKEHARGEEAARSLPSEILLLSPEQMCRGFSGGPVLNMQGEVVGVVRALVRSRAPRNAAAGQPDTQWVAATSVRHIREALAAFGLPPQ